MNQKMAVFQVLRVAERPLGLPEILEKLGPGFTERTLRRWLSEWTAQGLVSKQGQKRGTRYFVTSKQIESFTSASQKALDYVSKPLHQRKIVEYDEKWLQKYKPNETQWLSSSLKKQLFELGDRRQNHDPAGTYAQHIYNRLLIDLSYNSSRLEGNTYSLLETERLILKGESTEGKLDIETLMILNHKETIRYLVDHARRIDVSMDTICSVHHLLSENLIVENARGSVRNHSVRISGCAYLPLDETRRLTNNLQIIGQKSSQIQDPFEQSLFLLVHISCLQAFVDVNKRTARLCANIPFIKQNLVPCSFNAIDKGDYLSALIALYELQAVEPLIDLFVDSYTETCKAYDATVETLGFDEVRILYRQERRAIIRYIIENLVMGKDMDAYIQQQAESQVPEKDLLAFIDDVHEDLKLINPIRIAGLGVTREQLEAWLKIAR